MLRSLHLSLSHWLYSFSELSPIPSTPLLCLSLISLISSHFSLYETSRKHFCVLLQICVWISRCLLWISRRLSVSTWRSIMCVPHILLPPSPFPPTHRESSHPVDSTFYISLLLFTVYGHFDYHQIYAIINNAAGSFLYMNFCAYGIPGSYGKYMFDCHGYF